MITVENVVTWLAILAYLTMALASFLRRRPSPRVTNIHDRSDRPWYT